MVYLLFWGLGYCIDQTSMFLHFGWVNMITAAADNDDDYK